MNIDVYFDDISIMTDNNEPDILQFGGEYAGCTAVLIRRDERHEHDIAGRISKTGYLNAANIDEGEYNVKLIKKDGIEIKCGIVNVKRNDKTGKLIWSVNEHDTRDKLEELYREVASLRNSVIYLNGRVEELEKQNKKINGGYHII